MTQKLQPVKLESPMNSKKLAQMAVALEACKVLHQVRKTRTHLKIIPFTHLIRRMRNSTSEHHFLVVEFDSRKIGFRGFSGLEFRFQMCVQN